MVHERLTTGDAAKRSGLSVSTIKRKIQAKQLRAIRTEEGEWLIEHSDLMSFLTTQKAPTRTGASARPSNKESSEPTMARSTEMYEREVAELKKDKMKLEEKIERLEEENRGLMREYKDMMNRVLIEKNDLLKKASGEKVEDKDPQKLETTTPSRFLSKVMKAAKVFQEK